MINKKIYEIGIMEIFGFKYRDNIKLIRICLISAMLIIGGLYMPLLNFVALAVVYYGIFSMDDEDILCVMLFLLSFSPIFKLNIGGFTFFNLVIIGYLGRALITRSMIISRRFALYLILFSIYALIASGISNIIDVVTVIASLLMISLIYRPDNYAVSLKKMVVFASWGVLITSCLALIGDSLPRISSLLNKTTIRLNVGVYYYRFSGLMENPNYYTFFLSLVLAAISLLIIQNKAGIADYIYFVALSAFGIMSVSLSFIITYFVMVLILIICYSKGQPYRFVMCLLGVCITLFIIYHLIGKDTIDTILFRAPLNYSEIDGVELSTSGRTELWQYYISYLWNDLKALVFGVGLGASNLKAGASHSFYIEIVYYLGIIGGALYTACIFEIFKVKRYCVKTPKLYQYLPLVIFLIRATARNLILSEQLVFMLLFCSVAISDGNIMPGRMLGEEDAPLTHRHSLLHNE